MRLAAAFVGAFGVFDRVAALNLLLLVTRGDCYHHCLFSQSNVRTAQIFNNKAQMRKCRPTVLLSRAGGCFFPSSFSYSSPLFPPVPHSTPGFGSSSLSWSFLTALASFSVSTGTLSAVMVGSKAQRTRALVV